jgi:hypothetical protein
MGAVSIGKVSIQLTKRKASIRIDDRPDGPIRQMEVNYQSGMHREPRHCANTVTVTTGRLVPPDNDRVREISPECPTAP